MENEPEFLVLDEYTGEYINTMFERDGRVWKLIGSETGDFLKYYPDQKWNESSLGQTIDEFKGPKGSYLKAKRKSVFAMQQKGELKKVKK